MGVGKNFAPCNIILTTVVEKSSWNIGLAGPKWGTKGPQMCNSGSLGMGEIDFSGGMATGINSSSSYNAFNPRNAAVGVFKYFEASGP